MTFQVRTLAIYGVDGRVRRIDFRLNAMNVITGGSQTGKSALLEIVDYVTGGSARIPAGPVRDKAEWFGLELSTQGGNLFVARRAPRQDEAAPEDVYIDAVNRPGGDLPGIQELRKTTNLAGLVATLSAAAGIGENVAVLPEGSTRPPFAATIRHALWLCIQAQDELLSRSALFHEQGEAFHEQHLRDTLPYFLGAVNVGHVAAVQRLRTAERELRRTDARLDRLRDARERLPGTAHALLVEAASRGMISVGEIPQEPPDVLSALARLGSGDSTPAPVDGGGTEAFSRLRDQEEEMRSQVAVLQREIQSLRRVELDVDSAGGEATEQRRRMGALELIPEGTRDAVDEARCPFCEQSLEGAADATPSAVRRQLHDLTDRITNLGRSLPQVREAIAEREVRIEELRTEIRSLREQIDELVASEDQLRIARDVAVERGIVLGRVGMFLDSMPDANEIELGQERREQLETEVESLRQLTDLDAVRERVDELLEWVGAGIQATAQRLELEHSQHRMVLDWKALTVTAISPRGRIPLREMGSGENWVGYHIAAHLALHEFLAANRRPVPRLLMLDQPSQVYFPESSSSDAELPEADEDVASLSRMLRAVYDWVDDRWADGGFQVIVTEHANLPDEWFQECVVEVWRGGKKLVPDEWPNRRDATDG